MSGDLATIICFCKPFQVRPNVEASMGSVFAEWMLKIKFRVHVNARNCHEPHFHETAK